MRLLRTVHAWCGLFLALGLMVIGLTGAVSAFRPEILKLSVPQARAALPSPASFGPALDRFEAHGLAKVAVVSFNYAGSALHRVYLTDGRQMLIGGPDAAPISTAGEGRWEDGVQAFHHTFLAGRIGEWVVGALGLAGLAMVASGLLIWWPVRGAFRLRLWPRSARRGDLITSHRDLGVVLAVLLLAQLASGASLVFDQALQAVVPVVPPPPAPGAPVMQAGGARWAPVLSAAAAAVPEAKLLGAAAPDGPGKAFVVNFQPPGLMMGRFISAFVGRDGQVLRVDQPAPNLANQLMDARSAIHGGAYADPASRVLVGLTGLGLALLSFLGAWAFVQRLTRARS